MERGEPYRHELPRLPDVDDLKPEPSGLRKLPALPMWGAALFAVVAIQIVVTYVLMLPDGAERNSRHDQQDRAPTTTNGGLSNFGAADDDLSEVSLGDFSL